MIAINNRACGNFLLWRGAHAASLKRVFDIDLEHCPQCGGDFKIIAPIEEPAVIVKILTHLGLPARAAARSGAAAGAVPGGLILILQQR